MSRIENPKIDRFESEESIWQTLHPAKVSDIRPMSEIVDPILDYFEVPKTLKKHERFRGVRKSFPDFCRSLEDEQIGEILDYYLKNYDEARLICFFENLNIRQQQYFLDRLLTLVCEGKANRAVLKFRKKIFKLKTISLANVDDAIEITEHIQFEGDSLVTGRKYLHEVIRFLEENKRMIQAYLDGVSKKHPQGESVMKNIVKELIWHFSPKAKKKAAA